MSTENCKRYIKELSIEKGWPLDSKWKRIDRAKHGKGVVRTFENQYGQKAVIYQYDDVYSLSNADGSLNTKKLEQLELPKQLKDTLSKEKLLKGMIKEAIQYPKVYEAFNYYYTKNNIKESMSSLIENNDWTLVNKEIKEYDFKTNDKYDLLIGDLVLHCIHNNASFYDDISTENVGISYDMENLYAYFYEQEGVSYIKLEIGGDWEKPVHAMLYWSEKDQKMKGFFPLDKGNIYNSKEKTAYGSEMDSGLSVRGLKYDSEEYNELEEQFEEINNKVEKHYKKMVKTADEEGFKQLKQHLMNTEI